MELCTNLLFDTSSNIYTKPNRFIVFFYMRIMKDGAELKYVETELCRIMDLFEKNHTSREFLLQNTRKTVNMCSRSIVSVHKGDLEEGIRCFEAAHSLLKQHRLKATSDMRRYLYMSEQELTEAACLLAVYQKKRIPSPRSLSVSDEPYVLGLLDSIGELKRLTLDMLRAGNTDEANRIFDVTVKLYDELYGFAVYANSVKDLRKKIDAARIMIDGMRIIVVGESRSLARHGS